MSKPFTIRHMKSTEEERVCDLIQLVFNEFVAPHYSQKGVQEFLRYIDPVLLAVRIQSNHFILLAESGDELAGMIEVRHWNHISLLFIDGRFHRMGIARELIIKALEICKGECLDLSAVTVNSSPNAIEAYEKLGFHVEGPELMEHGIRFVRMRMYLTNGMKWRLTTR